MFFITYKYLKHLENQKGSLSYKKHSLYVNINKKLIGIDFILEFNKDRNFISLWDESKTLTNFSYNF